MIDYSSFLKFIDNSDLSTWSKTLPEQIQQGLSIDRFGDLATWFSALNNLPHATPSLCEFQSKVSVGCVSDIDENTNRIIEAEFRNLIPWRKGPYSLFGIEIDTEWRSDWKWDRLLPHIRPLKGRTILDVGCGNGYHCLRMYGEGASRVVGIDPSARFVVQFYMLKHFISQAIKECPVDVLPLGIELLPPKLQAFDTCFSMGILYHRRSPMDHLRELLEALKPGGELVLETLVIEGDSGEILVPKGRYAKMNNVWFIPSIPELMNWLKKSGFINVKCVDSNQTSMEEQRSTDWMKFHSLAEFLDPNDRSLTAEGHPAPLRAIFIAEKPNN